MRRSIRNLLVLLTLFSLSPGATALQAPADADKAKLVQGNTAFALDLYGQLRGKEGNLFLSPASISTALAMTYSGARGDTADEMARALHFTLGQERLHPAMGALIHDLNAPGKKRGYQLSVANDLWVQRGYPFLPDFVKRNKDYYGAGLQEVDFAGATEEARRTINARVEKQTREKIKDLLPDGVLSTDTRLVLTNAIYFKGDWLARFPKARTREGKFHVSKAETVPTPMMRQEGRFNYHREANFQALELTYVGKELSMVVFLPSERSSLADFEKALTADKLASWIGKLSQEKVDVVLPRFQVTAEFRLKQALSTLGMPQAFSPSSDFSGMDGTKKLFLSDVVHKAFVEVNEEGTEAAAATGVVIDARSASSAPKFVADRPFLFLLRDRRSGSILFLGRLVNPKK